MNMLVVETKRPLSKYAAKRAKKIIDLRGEDISETQPSMSMFLKEEDIKKEKQERSKKEQSIKEIVKDRLYTREGGEAFARGNPFAVAFNREINK